MAAYIAPKHYPLSKSIYNYNNFQYSDMGNSFLGSVILFELIHQSAWVTYELQIILFD